MVTPKECTFTYNQEDVLFEIGTGRDQYNVTYRYICPKCDRSLAGDECYCPECGERLDWSAHMQTRSY